ncbi:hypothetical protein AB3N02_21655 [Priestia aryabhattai]|uniref:hypothetical protein n=1 Tax=Priestia aryabhattai TaxID=412384 RepID=UPI00399F7A8D
MSKCDKAHIWNNNECQHCKIQELEARVGRYENIISAIYNIDCIFMKPDGSDYPWDDKLALHEIENMAKPVWEEICERSRKEMEEEFPGLFKSKE